MRLYLGAGAKRLDGYIHVDVEPGEGIDIAYDLNRVPGPWDDDAADIIVAEEVRFRLPAAPRRH